MLVTAKNALEYEPHQFCVEASQLAIHPSDWPQRINTTLGNCLPFHMVHFTPQVVTYRQSFGCASLKVFND